MGSLFIAIGATLFPFLFLFTQSAVVGGDMRYVFANVCGFMGAVCLTWEMALGIQYMKTKLSGKAGNLVKVHILLGIWGMFFILLHPILEMMTYTQIFGIQVTTEFGLHVFFGQIAFILCVLIWISSAIWRAKISRMFWYLIHLTSYALMALVFFHAFAIGSFLRTLLWVQVYWYTLLIVYLFVSIVRVFELFT